MSILARNRLDIFLKVYRIFYRQDVTNYTDTNCLDSYRSSVDRHSYTDEQTNYETSEKSLLWGKFLLWSITEYLAYKSGIHGKGECGFFNKIITKRIDKLNQP